MAVKGIRKIEKPHKKYVAVRSYEYYRKTKNGAVRVKVRAYLRRNKKVK